MLDSRFYFSYGPLTLADVIEGLEAKLPDPKFLDEIITHVSSLSGSVPGSITFLASKKSVVSLENCKATACFVTEDLAGLVGARHIIPLITKKPRAALARTMLRLGDLKTFHNSDGTAHISASANVHKTAVIGAGAVIDAGTIVGPNTSIGPGVAIGENCQIEENVSIKATVMGASCVVKAGAVVGGCGFGVEADSQGTMNIPHFGRVIMGDGVLIGANSCVDRGQIGDTVLGDNVKLDNLVQIGHNVQIGHGSRFAAQTGVSGSCTIGRDVMIGGGVGIADHIIIGDNVRIAAHAGVMSNIPSGEFWGGTPAQPMRNFLREVAVLRRLARNPKSI